MGLWLAPLQGMLAKCVLAQSGDESTRIVKKCVSFALKTQFFQFGSTVSSRVSFRSGQGVRRVRLYRFLFSVFSCFVLGPLVSGLTS